VGEAGQHVEVGRLPSLSTRAIEDWVVRIRRASSVWVSPARVRSVSDQLGELPG
jgi:hypothetical protein